MRALDSMSGLLAAKRDLGAPADTAAAPLPPRSPLPNVGSILFQEKGAAVGNLPSAPHTRLEDAELAHWVVFGARPDSSDLAFWRGIIQSGVSIEAVMARMAKTRTVTALEALSWGRFSASLPYARANWKSGPIAVTREAFSKIHSREPSVADLVYNLDLARRLNFNDAELYYLVAAHAGRPRPLLTLTVFQMLRKLAAFATRKILGARFIPFGFPAGTLIHDNFMIEIMRYTSEQATEFDVVRKRLFDISSAAPIVR